MEIQNAESSYKPFGMILTFLELILQKDFDLFLVGIKIYVIEPVLNELLQVESLLKEFFIFFIELT